MIKRVEGSMGKYGEWENTMEGVVLVMVQFYGILIIFHLKTLSIFTLLSPCISMNQIK
jgi:hypothetical protein